MSPRGKDGRPRAGPSPGRAATDLPYDTGNDLPEGVRAQVVDLLNQRLADAIDLDSQTKQAHWNVKGPHFVSLHKLFDEVHDAMEEYVALLAERVVQLGGIAAGTVQVVAGRTALPEYPSAIAPETEYVYALARSLAEFGGHVRRAIDQTNDWGDQVSSDICTEISRGVDQWLWFVEAHGQGRERRGMLALESNGGSR